MAYVHQRVEYVMLTCGGSAKLLVSATGERGNRWSPGHTPVTLRGVAIAPLVTKSITQKVAFQVRLVTTIGKASTSGQSQGTVTAASGANNGKIYYRKLNVDVKPTQEIALYCSTKAATTCTYKAILYVEPKWEEPANNTKMVLVTG